MTNAKIIERILKRLGNRSSEDLRDYALMEVQTKIQEYEMGPVLPWFLETEADLTTTAGTESVTLPSNFLREVEDGALRIQTADGIFRRLVKVDLERLRAEVEDEGAGFPTAYALFGSKIYLAPVPDAVYALKFPYFKRSETFEDNTDEATDWCKYASNLVIFGTAAQIAATHIMNEELALANAKLETRAKGLLELDNEARMNTNQNFDIED